jgi:tetratricopeptide (TPR) repeat protein
MTCSQPTAWRLVQRGQTYRLMKRYEESLKDLDQAIELNPQDVAAHNNRGITCYDQKNYAQATEAYKQAIKLNPQDTSLYINLGITYKAQKDYAQAIASYQSAIELNPDLKQAFANRGETYILMERYDEALKDFDQAIELDSEYYWVILRRCKIHEILGNYEETIKGFDMAISIFQSKTLQDGSLSNPQCQLGMFQYKLANYGASVQSFQKLIELYPANLAFSSNLGYLYLLQGNMDEAQCLIEPFMKDASFDRLRLNFGLIQALKGQLGEAIQSWKQGLEIMNDDSEWAQAVRYIFNIALGNPIEGLENMRQLIDSGADRFTLRNALNDATILSRCPQPIPGIDQMIQLLEEALAKFEPISFSDSSLDS